MYTQTTNSNLQDNAIAKFMDAWARNNVICEPIRGERYGRRALCPDHGWNIPTIELGMICDITSPDFIGIQRFNSLAEKGFRRLREESLKALPYPEFLLGFSEGSPKDFRRCRTVLHVRTADLNVPWFRLYTDEPTQMQPWLLFDPLFTWSAEGPAFTFNPDSRKNVFEAEQLSKDWKAVAVLLGLLSESNALDLSADTLEFQDVEISDRQVVRLLEIPRSNLNT